jgi:hypothetical protein
LFVAEMRLAVIAAVALAAAGALLGFQGLTQQATTAAPVKDVVVMVCVANEEDAPSSISFEVWGSSSSKGAPEIEMHSDCAQSLSDLLSVGFAIEDVQPWPSHGQGAYYNLVRNPGQQSS